MGAGYHGGFGNTLGARNKTSTELIAELKRDGIKFTQENIVFIVKDSTGQTVWLETGNAFAGLEHILNGNGESRGHAVDFERAFGISREGIPSFLQKVVSFGSVVSNKMICRNGRQGFERVYQYNGRYYVLVGLGENGFIVSAYPVDF